MTKMTSCVIMLAVLCGALLATTERAEGQSRWRRSRTVRSSRQGAVRATHNPTYSSRYRGTYPSRYYYPKYTGAFHARYFDGVPSIYGTHPMRGTAW